jgi:serine protease Do
MIKIMKKWLTKIIIFLIFSGGNTIFLLLKSPTVLGMSAYEIREIAINITVLILGPGSPGSGTIIAHNGDNYYVLTAGHVVESINSKEEADIKTHDNKLHQIDTKNIIRFADIDLAIVKFNSNQKYKTAEIGKSEKVFELSTVYVAGFPLSGEAIRQNFFITKGEVSSLDTFNDGGYDLVYTNTTRAGMSGGPVLNEDGELIGIHGRAEGTILADGTEIKQGFNLGIPIKIFVESAPRIGFDLKTGPILAQTPTPTPTPKPKPVETPTPAPKPKPVETPTPTPKPKPVETPTPTPKPKPVETPTPTPKPKPVETPTPTPTPKPVETPTPTPKPKPVETPTPTPKPKPVETPTPKPPSNVGSTLIAAKPGNDRGSMYQQLENFLKAEQWRKADQQTWELLKQVGNEGNVAYLTPENIKNFSCSDLKRIDDLWLKYSQNKFGFSVQNNIWQGLGGNANSDEIIWRRFSIRVGWKKGTEQDEGGYIPYDKLNFTLSAPNGHFPALSIGGTAAGIKAMDTLVSQFCKSSF